jgi:Ala-tRNA(Pro) deacylase
VLKELDINFTEYKHPAVLTCEEAEKYNKGGAKIKNLFLRNKKGNKHFLVIVEASKNIDLKSLGESIGENKLGFASEERLMQYLNLKTGAVSPFGLINDKNREVIVALDKDLLNYKKLNFHPNVNTATLQISKDDFLKFIEWCGNKLIIPGYIKMHHAFIALSGKTSERKSTILIGIELSVT